ncbi:MAG TPA: phospholipase D-like domain-containing protein [Dictyobacter sp.]|nr:phospholipase D-like domain-containing protein [Dictyobacter sp.]
MSKVSLKHTALVYVIMTIILSLTLISCDVNVTSNGISTSGMNTTNSNLTDVGSGTQDVQVFVEPDSGESVITNAINGAQKSIWVEMYLLTDKKVITALEDAAQRQLDVRVMLEQHPYGGSSISPTETLDKLKAAGIKAAYTNPTFALTHEKGMVIDSKTTYIMTANLTLSALGASSYTKNREYGIIDTNPQDVKAVSDIFTADWNRQDASLNDTNLVVSPINSRNAFASLINRAHKSLAVEAEEIQDSAIEQDLVNAAKRGVQVQVILPSPGSSDDSNSKGIHTIESGHVQVKEDKQLYMHAKIIIVDGQKAFVGSENISTASLNRNRELGIIISDQTVLTTLQQTFQQDWGVSQTA